MLPLSYRSFSALTVGSRVAVVWHVDKGQWECSQRDETPLNFHASRCNLILWHAGRTGSHPTGTLQAGPWIDAESRLETVWTTAMSAHVIVRETRSREDIRRSRKWERTRPSPHGRSQWNRTRRSEAVLQVCRSDRFMSTSRQSRIPGGWEQAIDGGRIIQMSCVPHFEKRTSKRDIVFLDTIDVPIIVRKVDGRRWVLLLESGRCRLGGP